jgi:hypothetical protein
MKIRRSLTLVLALCLAAAPAVAVPMGPLDLPGNWLASLAQWFTSAWAPVEGSGCIDPNGLTVTSQAAKVCRDASGAIIPCSTSTTDGGGCLDPHGRPTPCNPGP